MKATFSKRGKESLLVPRSLFLSLSLSRVMGEKEKKRTVGRERFE